MAGKSTFLRSLGINYILAMAGMPVFADTLRISRFRLFSNSEKEGKASASFSCISLPSLLLKVRCEMRRSTCEYAIN